MVDRINGTGGGVETPVGIVPQASALHLEGLSIPNVDLEALLRVSPEEWSRELPEIRAFFDRFGDTLPPELPRSLEGLSRRLKVPA
jgi:phosphoenolpyruvate carboxykinase (GTP)